MSSVNGDGFLSKFPSVCMVSLVFACFALLHRLEPLAQQSAERVWREPSSLPFSQAWGERTQCLAIKLMLPVGFSFFFSCCFLSSFLFFFVCVCVCHKVVLFTYGNHRRQGSHPKFCLPSGRLSHGFYPLWSMTR